MKKTTIVSILLIVLIITISVIGVSARPTVAVVSVDKIKEEKTEWCWATCVECVIEYCGTSVTQSEIVEFAHGNTDNEPGTLYDVAKSLTQWDISFNGHNVPLSFDEIISQIYYEESPIIAGIFPYGGGHMVVIDGYDEDGEYIEFMDPDYGTFEVAAYDYFKNEWDWEDSFWDFSKK